MKFKLKKKDVNEITKAFSLFWHIGITMAVCIIGCIILGRFLDEKLGTAPALLIVFIILGFASAIYSLYKIVLKYFK